jgi:hypothetical protein
VCIHHDTSEHLEPRTLLSGTADLFQTSDSLAEARLGPAAVRVGDQAIFVGGDLNFNLSNAVDIYNSTRGAWTTTRPVHARRVQGAAAAGSFALFAGGDNPQYTRLVDIYDAKTDRWRTSQLAHARGAFSATSLGRLAFFAGGSRIVDVFNGSSRRWSGVTLLHNKVATFATTVGTKLFCFGVLNDVADVYDTATHTRTTVAVPQSAQRPGIVIGVGTKVLFIGGTDASTGGDSDAVSIYDVITGQWSNGQPLPQPMRRLIGTQLGTKVLFINPTYDSLHASDVVDVLDLSTGAWSTTHLSTARGDEGATTVGTHAIFAGGGTYYQNPSSVVDIYTDTNPVPMLSGGVSGHGGGRITVTIFNTGDADLPAGATVQVYASAGRALDQMPILLGHANLENPLSAGASIKIIVPSNIKSLSAGEYHLVAAVNDGSSSTPTTIASQAGTFTVKPHAAANPATDLAVIPPHRPNQPSPFASSSLAKKIEDLFA